VNVRHYLEQHLWYLDELHAGDTLTVHWRFAARLDALVAEHARLAWPAPTCGVMAP
jgi:hypothetical protein